MKQNRYAPKPGQILGAAVALCGLVAAAPAYAYVGPGAGLSAIGAILALLGAVCLALLGFVWYPIKRFRTALRERAERKAGLTAGSAPAP